MIRGTTAYFKFIMPYNYDEVISARIIFWQEGYYGPTSARSLPIVKTLSYCAPTQVSNELTVSLTPEETARFTERRKAYVQMAGTSIEGARFGVLKTELTVYPNKGEDIGDDIVPAPDSDDFVIFDGQRI